MKQWVAGALAAVLVAGCSGALPSDDEAYRIACQALARDERIPPDAVPASFEEAGRYLAKNAGCVILPYTVATPDGTTTSASYTVWLKRVERVWQAERAYPTPTYSVEG